jgi:hypothetical protein
MSLRSVFNTATDEMNELFRTLELFQLIFPTPGKIRVEFSKHWNPRSQDRILRRIECRFFYNRLQAQQRNPRGETENIQQQTKPTGNREREEKRVFPFVSLSAGALTAHRGWLCPLP